MIENNVLSVFVGLADNRSGCASVRPGAAKWCPGVCEVSGLLDGSLPLSCSELLCSHVGAALYWELLKYAFIIHFHEPFHFMIRATDYDMAPNRLCVDVMGEL